VKSPVPGDRAANELPCCVRRFIPTITALLVLANLTRHYTLDIARRQVEHGIMLPGAP